MKYYIAGKKNKQGTLESDSEKGDLNEYFELGWEYITSHLHFKRMFVNGELNKDDVIVTLKDRMFFYEGFWDNVISYEDFLKISDMPTVIDYCNIAQNQREEILPKIVQGRYEHWNTDIDIIKNVNYPLISHLDTNRPYCCIHVRYRKWASFRNLTKDFWIDLIDKITKTGLKVYVFGKGSEELSDGENTIQVDFNEYAALLNNDNCKFLIGSMSGGTLVAQTFSHKNCTNYVIITDKQTYQEFKEGGVYKVFYHSDEMNFSEAEIKYVSYIDSLEDNRLMSLDELKNDLKKYK